MSLTSNFCFNVEAKTHGLARKGELKIDGKKAKTPILWFGTIGLKDTPKYWKITSDALESAGADAFLVNSFYVYKKNDSDLYSWIREMKDKFLFKADSGGYQNQKNDLNLNTFDIYNIQKKLEPDLAVPLDFPIKDVDSEKEARIKIDKTIDSLQKALNSNDSLNILPVLHGFNQSSVEYAIKRIKEVVEEIPAVALGGYVPKLRQDASQNSFWGKINLAETIVQIRRSLPKTFLHIMGTGSATTSLMFLLCGADSFDQTGWIVKAGFGQLQFMGQGDFFINKQKEERYEPDLNTDPSLKSKLKECKCPACENRTVKDLGKLNIEGRALRAKHNAWIHQRQMERFRKEISKTDDLREAVFNIVSSPAIERFLKKLDKYLVKEGIYDHKYNS